MVVRWTQRAFFFPFLFLACSFSFLSASAAAQSFPAAGGNGLGVGPQNNIDEAGAEIYMMDVMTQQAQRRREQQEKPSEGVSKLDLKAPGGARKEYEKGVSLLLKKDLDGAIEHLSRATAVYPKFVAAHNALGSAYMDAGKIDKAREEFEQATLLDDHLPNSFANLCHAELALKRYAAAEQAIKKASSLSPLNHDLLPTLVYAEVMNHDYQDAIATAHKVHQGKHEDAAMVHFFAAAAWREQKNLPAMEAELKTFLAEDPKSANADKARQLIAQIDEARLHPRITKVVTITQEPNEAMVAAQREEEKQVAEAERMCVGCSEADVPEAGATASAEPGYRPKAERLQRGTSGWVLRKSVDEVALFFAATDRHRAVSDLTQQEVGIRDDHLPPESIIDFRNESKLPLRLGLVIDTSESIVSRFSFEQGAAAGFLQKTLINKDDLAFVVGFSNSVLMVQDFTADQSQLSHAIGELAPAGGTALWDAVTYAADKLGSRMEDEPVAKMLVIISDGNDNSSKATLKQAIQAAERAQVIVYTVSTAEGSDLDFNYTTFNSTVSVGNSALRVLAEQSGGSAFTPGSVTALKRGLAELQEVIRSRYLISYKPAHFEPDGHYRTIDITAQKSGRKLRVYARKGYYSRTNDGIAQNF
ncbi:MAG: VWA domain-containing protein [Candidatus Sulfotelmatobacter sp.]